MHPLGVGRRVAIIRDHAIYRGIAEQHKSSTPSGISELRKIPEQENAIPRIFVIIQPLAVCNGGFPPSWTSEETNVTLTQISRDKQPVLVMFFVATTTRKHFITMLAKKHTQNRLRDEMMHIPQPPQRLRNSLHQLAPALTPCQACLSKMRPVAMTLI